MAETIKAKKCSKCKSIKPVSEFRRNKSYKDGHHSYCKKCNLEYCKKYRKKHRIERLEFARKYRQEHHAERSEFARKYHKEHHAEHLKYNKKYYKEHRVERSEYARKYYSSFNGHLRQVSLGILCRCNNPKNKRYKNYGGRGIEVKFACFEDFFSYVTKELKADSRGLTIDRIDNNGHYEPGNIRFVTRAENNRNR